MSSNGFNPSLPLSAYGESNAESLLDALQTAQNAFGQNPSQSSLNEINAASNALQQYATPFNAAVSSFGQQVQQLQQSPFTASNNAQQTTSPFAATQSTPNASPSPSGTSTGNAIWNAIINLLPGSQGKAGGVGFIDIVVIFVGLILIAGAVFGFRELTTTVVTGVSKGAELGAAAAA